jgi:serine/threonine protein kinase
MEELQVGDPLQVGPYLLLGRLGAGGMGQVFLGRSPGGRLVAVKVIRAELAGDPGFRVRFAREVAAARRVSGLFTAAVMDADPEAPLPWLVTGFVNGPSLAQAVADYGALPVASVLALAAGLAEGLSAVHTAGVVHRDLKPSNVLLAQDGPRVIDFGISQAADATVMTRTGMVVGSPGFMSPEQAAGSAVGPASDVFSLGAVLVFAATGKGPFGTGAATAQLYRVVHGTPSLEQLPGQVRPLVEHCLAKEPAQRPTAGQFLAELTAAHPSAANLTDWLPASILPVTSPLPTPAAEPTAPVAASPGMQAACPVPAAPPIVAVSGSTAPEAVWLPTVTAAARHSPGSASLAADEAGLAHAAGTHEGTDTPQASAAPVSPVPSRPSWLAVKAGIPARLVTARGTAAGKRRRRWAVAVIAAAAVLSVVIGLITAAPWTNPPVLRPTGLITDSSTISSVAFRWSSPATGPAPDRYEILRDGRPVASVPGNIAFYQDKGLAPDSFYKFQVIAIRGGRLSSESAVLSMSTLIPPVSDAVLNGTWGAFYTVTTVVPVGAGGWKDGDSWSDTWTFTPACAVGPCDVTLAGKFYGWAFTTSLSRSGAVYTGTVSLDKLQYCVRSSNYTPSILRIRIQVQEGGVAGQAWRAISWGGTTTLEIPHNPVGNCFAGTVKVKVGSS